jgi:hypothetical protein
MAGPATDLGDIVRSALTVEGVESAAIFISRAGSLELELAAAAGIEGPPLDGLVAAVRHPDHPIARAVHDPGPTFDVRPMSPGGPALRSHLPLGGLAVLAVAHDRALSSDARSTLERLAASATGRLDASDG